MKAIRKQDISISKYASATCKRAQNETEKRIGKEHMGMAYKKRIFLSVIFFINGKHLLKALCERAKTKRMNPEKTKAYRTAKKENKKQ